MTSKLWGYKPDGSSRLFIVGDGEKLPDGWSPDVAVIKDESKRTGESVSTAAGQSVFQPVPVSRETAKEAADAKTETAEAFPLQYDEDNLRVVPKKRVI